MSAKFAKLYKSWKEILITEYTQAIEFFILNKIGRTKSRKKCPSVFANSKVLEEKMGANEH